MLGEVHVRKECKADQRALQESLGSLYRVCSRNVRKIPRDWTDEEIKYILKTKPKTTFSKIARVRLASLSATSLALGPIAT